MRALIVLSALVLALCGFTACNSGGGSDTADAVTSTATPNGPKADTGPGFTPFELDSTQLKQTASGLRYQIITQGGGNIPQPGQEVMAHYHGTLPDGTVFDSSFERGSPFSFALGQGRVIAGWDEFFGMVPVGTKAIIILPPKIAYGDRDMGAIPANSTLRFDVELLGITTGSQPQMGF